MWYNKIVYKILYGGEKMSFKTVNGLMKHLRDNGIEISGSVQKQQLRNSGYFHGYKGYRFFNKSSRPIPFKSYNEVYATIKYDTAIKSLLYGKVMYIETAVKNIALERIMLDANSENIQDMYKRVISSYSNMPPTAKTEEKKKAQFNKLKLENKIQSVLSRAYEQDNPQVTHFYNNMSYGDVPLWALFEILTLGDFAYLLSCLTFDTREHITVDLGMKVVSVDTNRELIYRYLYALKDLRNAIAHNSVVFDTRFRKFDPKPAMTACLKSEFRLPYVNFKTIGDYVILVCFYLKLLNVSKTEIKSFIKDFKKITENYRHSVSEDVSKLVIHSDLSLRLTQIKNSL